MEAQALNCNIALNHNLECNYCPQSIQNICAVHFYSYLHSKTTMASNAVPYCTVTALNTEVTMLVFLASSTVIIWYLHSYSVGVPAWVLQGNSRATLEEQHSYFCVGTSTVTVQ